MLLFNWLGLTWCTASALVSWLFVSQRLLDPLGPALWLVFGGGVSVFDLLYRFLRLRQAESASTMSHPSIKVRLEPSWLWSTEGGVLGWTATPAWLGGLAFPAVLIPIMLLFA